MSKTAQTSERTVISIPSKATYPFIMGIHYARRIPCIQYAYGLYEGEKLVGICTYGQPASPSLCVGIAGEKNRKKVLELNRLCFLPEYNGDNRSSILISQSLKQLPAGMIIVSYADGGGWGHVGYVYQATNWHYTGMTKARTDKKSANGGHSRHYKDGELLRQDRSAKHRYYILTGGKADKKALSKEINYPTLPYPKGESHKYDTRNPIASKQ